MVNLFAWKNHTHPIPTPTALAGIGTNLNSLMVTGVYHQAANVNALLSNNYPVAWAGLLEVIAGAYVYQRYTPYRHNNSISVPVEYTRNYYNNVWGPWRGSAQAEFLPGGVVLYAQSGTLASTDIPTTGIGLGEVDFTLAPNRLYEITWHAPQVYPPSGGIANVYATICYTTNGAAVTKASTLLRRQQHQIPGLAVFDTLPDVVQTFSVSSGTPTYKFLGVLTKGTGTISYRNDGDSSPMSWKIVDLGPTSAATAYSIIANTG